MEKLLVKLGKELKSGYNPVFKNHTLGMKLTSFGILALRKGETYTADTGDNEVALVILGGKCSVKGKDFDFAEVGGRKGRVLRQTLHGLSSVAYGIYGHGTDGLHGSRGQ